MSLALNLTLLAVGLAALWIAGEKTAEYSKSLAAFLGLKGFIFGFIVVALATNTPEIANAVVSTVSNVPELSAGDLVGSAAVNLSFVVGIAVLTAGSIKISGKKSTDLRRTGLIVGLVATFLLLYGKLDIFSSLAVISAFFIAALVMEEGIFEQDFEASEGLIKMVSGFVLWTVVLLGSSRLVVGSSIFLAEYIGIEIQIVGATVVALGTGLPELSYEVNAVRKGEFGMALGDAVGSTLVNSALLLGTLSLLNPGMITLEGMKPALLVIIAGAYITTNSQEIDRRSAAILLLLFALYLPATFLL